MTDTQISGKASVSDKPGTFSSVIGVGLMLLTATPLSTSVYPDNYYDQAIQPSIVTDYNGNQSPSGGLIVETSTEFSSEVVTSFVKDLVDSQHGLDEDIIQHINDNFFDLI
ncbi:MAG: hypothetical protein QTN59_16365 [Candidatus Electrothrix communis]|nr:MAG: hypothetical protein QTN59_16365 [Candidatus Electrothrix communis]